MLILKPLSLKDANALVKDWHRHHQAVLGHKFSIGVLDDDGELRGAVIVGRPVGRHCDDGWTAEVTRLVTDGTKNACSILYAAAARTAKGMGYRKIQTYILLSEAGTSLRASGWTLEDPVCGGEAWNSSGGRERFRTQLFLFGTEEKAPAEKKQRWSKALSVVRESHTR